MSKINRDDLTNKEMCLALVGTVERRELYTKLNENRIKNIREYLSKSEGIIFKVSDKFIIDDKASEPYAEFKYIVEGEEVDESED